MDPANVALEFVEIRTGSSNFAKLRIVHGAITTAIASSITAACLARPRQPSVARHASGRIKSGASNTASPRVSAASPARTPIRAPVRALGTRAKRIAAHSVPAMNGP